MPIKKIAVITPGGDAPGMNAALRATVREAIYRGFEVFGVQHGYSGLIDEHIIPLNLRSVSGIINRGGTFLKTRRCPEMRTREGMERAVSALKKRGIGNLIVIGGDGSIQGGARISSRGIGVIGIPASIDNDIYGTDETIGFDTAVNTSVNAIDKIRDTATSHERVFIVEVMGREHGFLTLAVGFAAGAEFIIVPEVKFTVAKLCADLRAQHHRGKTSLIIVFAEGAGNPYELAKAIEKRALDEVRVSTLGYIQRGGAPSARSRALASRFGAHAADLLAQNKKNRLVVLQKGLITDVPLSASAGRNKKFDIELHGLAQRLAT